MNLISLVVWAQPWLWVLGRHQWVLDLSATVLVGGGVWAAYRLARKVLPTAAALVAVGSVVALPGWLRDASTYMTDAPAFGLGAMSLLAGVAAVEHTGRRRAWLWGACLGLGFWGFTVREVVIAAPLAALIAAARRDRSDGAGGPDGDGREGAGPRAAKPVSGRGPRSGRGPWVAAAGFTALCGLFYLWRQGLPGGQPLPGHAPVLGVAATLARGWFTASLALVPVLVATAPRWWRPVVARARVRGLAIGAVVALLPVVVARKYGGPPAWLLGDYLDRRGLGGNEVLLGNRSPVLAGWAWSVVVVVAVVAGVVTAGLVAERAARWAAGERPPAAPALAALRWHCALTVAALAAAAVLDAALLDRYLWPAVLPAAILLLADRPPARPGPASVWRPGVAALAALAALALVMTANSDAYDSARWRAAQSQAGFPPLSIDAGFEWIGAHAATVADPARRVGGDPDQSWWTKMFALPVPCVEVANSPLDVAGYRLTGTLTWRPLLLGGTAHLYIYRRAGCPSA